MLAAAASLKISNHRRWNPIVKPVATKYLQTPVVGAVIGSRWAGRNGIERVADDIGKDQRDQTRGRYEFRKLPAFQSREMFSQRVDFADAGPAFRSEERR